MQNDTKASRKRLKPMFKLQQQRIKFKIKVSLESKLNLCLKKPWHKDTFGKLIWVTSCNVSSTKAQLKKLNFYNACAAAFRILE